jgi:hypothetical protein
MYFQPKVKDFVIAHPVPLLFLWLPLGGIVGYRFYSNWDALEPSQQVAVAFLLCGAGFLLLLSAPKVWWHVYQKRKHKLAGIDPELLRQQRRRKLNIVLSLVAVGLFEYVVQFLDSHTASENTPQYMTAIGLAGSLSLLPFVIFHRSRRSWSSYLFLAMVFMFGVAGVWFLENPRLFIATYPDALLPLWNNKQLVYYLGVTVLLCTVVPPLIVLVTLTTKAASWMRTHTHKPVSLSDKPIAVTWCLPVPSHSPDAKAAILPDYCKAILSSKNKAAA